jgi:hypothetical protein
MLPSVKPTTSAPETFKLSRLNGWPMRSPTDASTEPSRIPPHGSGPMWFATPSSRRTFTPYSLPVSTGAPVCLSFAPCKSGQKLGALKDTYRLPGRALCHRARFKQTVREFGGRVRSTNAEQRSASVSFQGFRKPRHIRQPRSLARSDRSRIGGCRGRRRGPVGSLAAVSTIDFCSAECGAVRP